MDQPNSTTLRDLVVSSEIDEDYYDKVRVIVYSEGHSTAELESQLAEVTGNPVREATVRDLMGDRPAALKLLKAAAGKEGPWAALYAGRMLLELGRTAQARTILKSQWDRDQAASVGACLVEALVLTDDPEGAQARGEGPAVRW